MINDALKIVDKLLLIGYEESGKYKHIGTGFIITENGFLVTAGHVFEKYRKGEITLEKFYCAFPSKNSELIKFEDIYIEYKPYNETTGMTIRDLAFAKINCKTDTFFQFETHRSRLEKRCSMIGLVNMKKEKGEIGDNITFSKNENGTIDFEKVKPENLPVTILDKFLHCKCPETGKTHLFNNCFSIDRGLPKGASGCPILDKNDYVVGMFFGGFRGGDKFILHSGYIKKKFHEYLLKRMRGQKL